MSRYAYSRGEWLPGDLFFLLDALEHGMSLEQVAGFLGRSVEEVCAKAHLQAGAAIADEGVTGRPSASDQMMRLN